MARLLVAHGLAPAYDLLRATVAAFHDAPGASIVVVHHCPRCGSDDHGAPRILATAALRHPARVSLARAGELSIVAVSDAGAVGVDLERVDAARGAEAVALHPDERASGVDPTRAWVRKEALLKACGVGLAVDPALIAVDDSGLARWDAPIGPPARPWLRDLDAPDHVAAVVVLLDDGVDRVDVEVRVGQPAGGSGGSAR